MTEQDNLGSLLRWYVYTDQGRKVAWQPTAEAAKARAEYHGLAVDHVEPAPPAA